MSPSTTEKFWQLLGESQLISTERLAELRSRFAEMRGATQGNAPLLAEWLAAENAITRYHAEVLLKGRSGPFRYGDFEIRDRYRRGRLTGHFRAVHTPTGHPVLLVFFASSAIRDPAAWPAIQSAAANSYSFRSPQLTCCHEIVEEGPYKFAVLEEVVRAGETVVELRVLDLCADDTPISVLDRFAGDLPLPAPALSDDGTLSVWPFDDKLRRYDVTSTPETPVFDAISRSA